MIKVGLDHASAPVREFVQSLPIDQEEVERQVNDAVELVHQRRRQ